MSRKLGMVLVVGLLWALPVFGAESNDKELEQALNALNDAFRTRDVGSLKKFMTEDHVSVTLYYGGPTSRDEQIKALPDLKLTEYVAGKMQMKSLGKDAVLITYSVTMKGTYKGKALAPKAFASAIWVKQNEKWQETFYQETAFGGVEK